MIRSILRSGALAWQKYAGSPQTLTRFAYRRLSSTTGTNNAKGEIANNATRELVTMGVTLSQESLSQIGSVVAADSSSSYARFVRFFLAYQIARLGGTLVSEYKEHRDNLRMPTQPRSSYPYMMKLAQRDKYRLDRLRKKKGLDYSLYPYVSVVAEGQKIITSFTIPAICNIPDLLRVINVSNLGLKVEDLRDSNIERSRYRKVDWRLTNERKQEEEEDLTVQISHSNYGNESVIEFIKGGSLTDKELVVLVNVLQLVGESTRENATSKKPKTPGKNAAQSLYALISNYE